MQNQFQPLLGSRIRKDQPAHFCAIQCTVIRDVIIAKGRTNRRNGLATGLRQAAGDCVRVDDACAMFSEQAGHRAFTAAYPTGESYTEPHSNPISKVKQGGCTRKGYAVRFPMLRIDRDAKRTTQEVPPSSQPSPG